MAIGATIASRLNNDEFDIDVVAKLKIDRNTPPAEVLDALYDAVNGAPGSIYYGKVTRNSRCVTIEYDQMHLDITPAVPMPELDERTSTIFHANEKEPPAKHRHIVANPWGFAHWFTESTPEVQAIVGRYCASRLIRCPIKSTSSRSLRHSSRFNCSSDGKTRIRQPRRAVSTIGRPRLFCGDDFRQATDLFTELRIQSNALYADFAEAQRAGVLVAVHNPRCATDVLTDRWPADLKTQAVFVDDLVRLSAALDRVEADPTPETCAAVFAQLFGEKVTQVVMEEFAAKFASRAATGGLFSGGGARGIALGASGLSASSGTMRGQAAADPSAYRLW